MARIRTSHRVLSVLLALVLVCSMLPAALGAQTAAPSRQKLTLDGKAVSAAAYVIDGYNYFKLRDLAALLGDTQAKFSVTADNDARIIRATTGADYAPVGGELATAEAAPLPYAESAWVLEVNGTAVDAGVYNLGGNNYFKLRDLGVALGFGVGYDAESDTAALTSAGAYSLVFNGAAAKQETVKLEEEAIAYTAYTDVVYTSTPLDAPYQSMNIFVPEGADEASPIFLKSGSGAYMAAKAKTPTGESTDVITRALAEGYVVISPAARGRNLSYNDGRFYGTGPANAVDLKAALRYLRYNDAVLPGDCDKIVVDGTSASGAMGAILGTSGDSALYQPYLDEIGAAPTSDAIYAAVSFCPIVDLDNCEIAYEWMYGPYYDLAFYQDAACDADRALSDAMAGYYPAYLNGLNLKDPVSGAALTLDEKDIYSGSYMTYLLGHISDAATAYLGKLSQQEITAYLNAEDAQGRKISTWLTYDAATGSAAVTDFNGYVTGWYKSPLKMKTVPSFNDIPGRHAGEPFYESFYSENSVFGTYDVQNRNFSNFLSRAIADAQKAGYWKDLKAEDYVVADDVKVLCDMYNPMYWIATEDEGDATFASHFYVRVGAKDHDTSQTIATNYATALMNGGHDVDFKLQWERQHEGDYEMDEMFTWLSSVLQ